jgi:hypothetical protein
MTLTKTAWPLNDDSFVAFLNSLPRLLKRIRLTHPKRTKDRLFLIEHANLLHFCKPPN